MKYPTRARIVYALVAAIVVAVGLSTRLLKRRYPALGDIAGDALWATMMFMLVSFVSPTTPLLKRAGIALAIAFAVEFSQLYHAPWIDRLRARTLGALVLGSGFDPIDLVSYTVGVGFGMVLEGCMLWRRPPKIQR